MNASLYVHAAFLGPLLFVLAHTPGAHAGDAPSWRQEFDQAYKLFRGGLAGERDDAEAAAIAFERLAPKSGAHPLVVAYRGAARAVLGRYASRPWKKMKHVESGLGDLDAALASITGAERYVEVRAVAVPLEVKLVAATSFSSIPAFFHRSSEGKRLVAELVADPELTKTPVGFQAAVYLQAALAAKDDKDMPRFRRALERVVALDPDSPDGKTAERMLAEARP